MVPKAAEQDDIKAQCLLGICYEEGHGVEQDKAEAAKWYRKAAEQCQKATGQEHVEVQLFLGDRYYRGLGVEQDKAEAVKWYRKAAERGNPEARWQLRKIEKAENEVWVLTGEVVPTEPIETVRAAADAQDAEAHRKLGLRYEKASRTKLDRNREMVPKAAEQENAMAQQKLGACYYYGHGLSKTGSEK